MLAAASGHRCLEKNWGEMGVEIMGGRGRDGTCGWWENLKIKSIWTARGLWHFFSTPVLLSAACALLWWIALWRWVFKKKCCYWYLKYDACGYMEAYMAKKRGDDEMALVHKPYINLHNLGILKLVCVLFFCLVGEWTAYCGWLEMGCLIKYR